MLPSSSSVIAVVILTLLIIEMVAFPMAWGHRGVGIDLLRVNHPVQMRAADREDAIVVAILPNGKVFFGNERVISDQLRDRYGRDFALINQKSDSRRANCVQNRTHGTVPDASIGLDVNLSPNVMVDPITDRRSCSRAQGNGIWSIGCWCIRTRRWCSCRLWTGEDARLSTDRAFSYFVKPEFFLRARRFLLRSRRLSFFSLFPPGTR
jgi:hypothetical protein